MIAQVQKIIDLLEREAAKYIQRERSGNAKSNK